MGRCPSCGEYTYLGDQMWIGQQITCNSCDDTLEIIKLDPVILDWVFISDNGNHYFDEEFEFG
jgi:hypothetical protein